MDPLASFNGCNGHDNFGAAVCAGCCRRAGVNRNLSFIMLMGFARGRRLLGSAAGVFGICCGGYRVAAADNTSDLDGTPMMANQGRLPRLPLPSLDETLARCKSLHTWLQTLVVWWLHHPDRPAFDPALLLVSTP